ncbi:unnamed protein product [Discosporangium mesarthrocarpum]
MSLQPKKTKFRKFFKPRQLPKAESQIKNLEPKSTLAIVAMESNLLNGRQIESARQNIRRKLKRKGRLLICVLPDLGISKKASAARMGKGKGKVNLWVSQVRAGKTIFLLTGVIEKEGKEALLSGGKKLPFKIKVFNQI